MFPSMYSIFFIYHKHKNLPLGLYSDTYPYKVGRRVISRLSYKLFIASENPLKGFRAIFCLEEVQQKLRSIPPLLRWSKFCRNSTTKTTTLSSALGEVSFYHFCTKKPLSPASAYTKCLLSKKGTAWWLHSLKCKYFHWNQINRRRIT